MLDAQEANKHVLGADLATADTNAFPSRRF
jgi:hypothetical protein